MSAHSASTPKACPSCGARYPLDVLFCVTDGSPLTTSPQAVEAAAASDPYVGREILGHIQIRQLVGIGAMGRVYRCFQTGIDRDVAVKILHRELSANQTLVARFHREAKVASRLQHPNVVHVLLVGQLPDGAMYIVMEYLDGLSLQSALAGEGGALPLPRALHVALPLCDAVGEAHAQGIVHRDIKPENVMLVRRADDPDFVKVLDFGIARLNWGEQSMATAAGLIFGTARYISPEGAQGERVGPQGDVYSIATMVYQMLAGRTPFDGDQAVALLVHQIHDEPPPLKSIERAAYVPEPIAAVVMRNLSKKALDRAESARALGRALLEAAVESGLSAQDFLARPGMLSSGRSGSPPSIVQMTPLQRTRQMQLEPEIASRIAPPKTAYIEPAASVRDGSARPVVKTEIAEPDPAPRGAATTKWLPPSDFAARLVAAKEPEQAAVEQTMDDSQAARSVPSPTRTLPLAKPVSQIPTAPPSKPSSSVDATMADEEAPPPARSATTVPPAPQRQPSHGRTAMLVVGFFLVGALGMAALAYQAGFVGSARPHAARPAESNPAGTPPPQADRPSASETSTAPPPLDSVPPLAAAKSAPSAGGVAAARVAIDASSAKPGVGRPVDFTARVAGSTKASRPRVEAPRFVVSGPGVGVGSELPASDDGSGAFRTTFTFLQGGRFEVTFSARADGAPVRATRVVQVGEPKTLPTVPPPATAPAAQAPPATSGGWM